MIHKERWIIRDDSACFYGIAILLMIYYHCFCIPERLHYEYIPVLGNFEFEARLAWIAKLCVAIYAFITGYAFSAFSDREQASALLPRLRNNYLFSFQQARKFYAKFWIVFFIFVPIGILFFNKSRAMIDVINGLLRGGGGYNGEWWYVTQYLKFLLVYPLVELAFYYKSDKKTWIIYSLLVITILFVRIVAWESFAGKLIRLAINQLLSNYMIIFLTAFLIGKLYIYEKIAQKQNIPIYIYAFIGMGCIIFRWFYVTGPAQSDCDILLTPFMMFAMTNLLHAVKAKSKFKLFLRFFGKHSTFMWLTHSFWLYSYFQKIVLLPRLSVFIYIWVVILSLGTSIVLTWIHQKINGFNKMV